MDAIGQLLIGLSCGLFLLIIGGLLYKFPPKTINTLYGYRTNRSMRNQDTWDSANSYAAKWVLRFGSFTCHIAGASYIEFPYHNALISIISMVILVVLVISLTESHLKRHFDKDGTPKSETEDFKLPESGVASGENK